MPDLPKIGFGGGCHWCTEAVFQALSGVSDVAQGYVKAMPPHDTFSEAVIVEFDPEQISLDVLVEIHLRTHSATAQHRMRGKYRSAVYTFGDAQAELARAALEAAQGSFAEPLITQVLPFVAFKPSDAVFQNYYETRGERPFCKTYIDPKLALLRREYSSRVKA